MNLGGPVWHASGKGTFAGQARAIALSALEGVGDESLGQWEEKGRNGVHHIRRRLSTEEEAVIGPARDIRMDEAEVARRGLALIAAVPIQAREQLSAILLSELRDA